MNGRSTTEVRIFGRIRRRCAPAKRSPTTWQGDLPFARAGGAARRPRRGSAARARRKPCARERRCSYSPIRWRAARARSRRNTKASGRLALLQTFGVHRRRLLALGQPLHEAGAEPRARRNTRRHPRVDGCARRSTIPLLTGVIGEPEGDGDAHRVRRARSPAKPTARLAAKSSALACQVRARLESRKPTMPNAAIMKFTPAHGLAMTKESLARQVPDPGSHSKATPLTKAERLATGFRIHVSSPTSASRSGA